MCILHSYLRDSYDNIHGTFRHIDFVELRFAPVQLVLNFCLPAACAALASKRNVP